MSFYLINFSICNHSSKTIIIINIIARTFLYVLIVERVTRVAKTRLKAHQQQAHSSENCNLCNKVFSHYSTLSNHKRSWTRFGSSMLWKWSKMRNMALHLKNASTISIRWIFRIKLSFYSCVDIFCIGSVFCGSPPFVHDAKMCSYFFYCYTQETCVHDNRKSHC